MNNLTQKFGGINTPYLVNRHSGNVLNKWGKKKKVHMAEKSKLGLGLMRHYVCLGFFPRGYKESKFLSRGLTD